MMIQEAGEYSVTIIQCIITHFKATGCLSCNKVRALTCTLMKTGWPLSNWDDRDRRGSKTKPAEASTHRAAVNLSHKQNASCTSDFPRPLHFLKAWKQQHCFDLWPCRPTGSHRSNDSGDFKMTHAQNLRLFSVWGGMCGWVGSQGGSLVQPQAQPPDRAAHTMQDSLFGFS